MRRQDEHRKLEELARQEELKRKQIDWEIAQRVCHMNLRVGVSTVIL